jgi:hypothetical protein
MVSLDPKSKQPKCKTGRSAHMSDRDSEGELRRSRKRETNRISRARNKDRVNAERRVRYATDPEFRAKVLKDARKDTLKRKYGLSLQDYDKMLARQAGVYKICRRNSAALGVDHCHDADKLRSLLCTGLQARRCCGGQSNADAAGCESVYAFFLLRFRREPLDFETSNSLRRPQLSWTVSARFLPSSLDHDLH